MKKKVISALSILWRIAIPLLSAVIGLKIVEKFNVFQILHIIDDADKAFDVCTTVYFAIVDVALLFFAEWIKNTFFTPQIIQVTLSKPGDMVQKSSVPDLLLYENRPCEARLTVKISAKKKTCKDLKLTIEGINFATMQLPAASAEASVDANGNLLLIWKRCLVIRNWLIQSKHSEFFFQRNQSMVFVRVSCTPNRVRNHCSLLLIPIS